MDVFSVGDAVKNPQLVRTLRVIRDYPNDFRGFLTSLL
jgi:hypothetical protein